MRIQAALNYLQQERICSHVLASGIDMLKLDPAPFSARERRLLRDAAGRIGDLLKQDPQEVVTVVRIGYADPCKVRALRKPARELMLPSPSVTFPA
jgi:hypothetical protein